MPGEQGQSDFINIRDLEVVIAGEPIAHLVLSAIAPELRYDALPGVKDGGMAR